MELVLFSASFLFSLIFIILGFYKENSVLALVGGISFMIVSLFLITTQLQVTEVGFNEEYMNFTETTYTIAEESSVPVGYLFLFFGALVFLYSGRMILYGSSGA